MSVYSDAAHGNVSSHNGVYILIGGGGASMQDDSVFILTGYGSQFGLSRSGFDSVIVEANNVTVNQGDATMNFIYDFAKNLSLGVDLELDFPATETVYGFYESTGAHINLVDGSYQGKALQTATETPYRANNNGHEWGTKVTISGPLMATDTIYAAYVQHVNIVGGIH